MGDNEKRGIPIGAATRRRPIEMATNIKVHFNDLQLEFQTILDDHAEELTELTKKAVDSFDFEKVLEEYVHERLQRAIEDAFREIDVTDKIKLMIWTSIEKKLGGGI